MKRYFLAFKNKQGNITVHIINQTQKELLAYLLQGANFSYCITQIHKKQEKKLEQEPI